MNVILLNQTSPNFLIFTSINMPIITLSKLHPEERWTFQGVTNFFVLFLLSMFYFSYQLIIVIVVSFLLSALSFYVCYLSMVRISFLLLLSSTDNGYADFDYVQKVDTYSRNCSLSLPINYLVSDTRRFDERLSYN